MESNYDKTHFFMHEKGINGPDCCDIIDCSRFCADVACIVAEDEYCDIHVTHGHLCYASRTLGRSLTKEEVTLFTSTFDDTIREWTVGQQQEVAR